MTLRWKIALIVLVVWIAAIAVDSAHAGEQGFHLLLALGATDPQYSELYLMTDKVNGNEDLSSDTLGVLMVGYRYSALDVSVLHISSIETAEDPGLNFLTIGLRFD